MGISTKPHIAKSLLTAFMFFILRTNSINYKITQDTLKSNGLSDIRTATHWINILIDNDDPLILLQENRANTTDDFYELFPGIKAEAQIYRHEFVKNFDISQKSFGFLQKLKDVRTFLVQSIVRIENECLLLCHDESTFRSGESAPSRWVWNKE
jgi:hypothetical protein